MTTAAATLTREHALKCWPEFYTEVIAGRKNFEIRRNDRGFKVGDTLWLREWSPRSETYSNRSCRMEVTYLTTYEQQPGMVVLGLASLAASQQPESEVTKVVSTAPKRIWLQVSDEDAHFNEPFPEAANGDVSWCVDSVMACEVEYIRADLSAPASPAAPGMVQVPIDRMRDYSAMLWAIPKDSVPWCNKAYDASMEIDTLIAALPTAQQNEGQFREYRRTQIAEMADWHQGFDMVGVSVSDADKAAGSPKSGDKIARNPANHADRWLVAADYFAANFEEI